MKNCGFGKSTENTQRGLAFSRISIFFFNDNINVDVRKLGFPALCCGFKWLEICISIRGGLLLFHFLVYFGLVLMKQKESDGQATIEMGKLEASNWIILLLPKKTSKNSNNFSKLRAAITKTRKKFHIVDFWILKTYSERTSLQNTVLHSYPSTLALHLNSFPVLCSALNSFWIKGCVPTHDKYFTAQGSSQACRTIPIALYR